MGTRFEFFEAKRSVVRVWDAVQTEDEAGETIDAGLFTLALDGDTVAGFVGTLDELRTLVARITRELDSAEPPLPVLPTPEDDDEDVQAYCPYVWTQDDVDAAKARNVKWNASLRQMHGDAANVVDVDTYGVPTVGEVCGDDLVLWDKDPQYGPLYTEGGRWIVGPRKGGDNCGGDEEVQCGNGHQWAVPDIDEWQ